MRLLRLVWLIGMAAGFAPAIARAQSYQPKAGETVLRLEVEARGTVHILLHTREAPRTTAHIIRLAKNGFYDGQRFFRVVTEPRPYLVAFGDPKSKDPSNLDRPDMGQTGSGARIPYEESGFKNDAGAVGLSTLPKDRNSGDSQFYILLAPSRFLDGNYTVFGKVVAGMDVVKKIQKGDLVERASIVEGR
jgi:peptidyl-prolyl cis-trans isomerase B (cyclophilin B)